MATLKLNPHAPEFLPYPTTHFTFTTTPSCYFYPPPLMLQAKLHVFYHSPVPSFNGTWTIQGMPPPQPLPVHDLNQYNQNKEVKTTDATFKGGVTSTGKRGGTGCYISRRKYKQVYKPKGMGILKSCCTGQVMDLNEAKTTVMIKNIPNKYSREMLVALLDKHCDEENKGQTLKKEDQKHNPASGYDFVYLPMDFGSKCNKGYAFVNFTSANAVQRFNLFMHSRTWGILNSKKIAEITYGKIQGKAALIRHFEKSAFACDTDDFLPVYFNPHRDGSGGSVARFTVGKRVRPFQG